MLERENVYSKLFARGLSASYLNAFPKKYFQYVSAHPLRIAATTYAWISTGKAIHGVPELIRGQALSSDITSERWESLGHPQVPKITPEEAGQNTAKVSEKYDFTFFEIWLTDKAGHNQSLPESIFALELFDDFLGTLIDHTDLSRNSVVITSDHGNLEDLSTKSHTRNPVPFILLGRDHHRASECSSLTDVTPFILSLLN
jgi:2,3-bisphosphoglycerate-independent phosphoglycerate mutase